MPPIPAETAERPPQDVAVRPWRLPAVVAGAVVLTLVAITVTALVPRTSQAQAVGDLAILAAAVLAVVSCAAAARRGGPSARAWTMLTVAMLVWTGAHMMWTWYGLTRDHVYPFPSVADLGYIGYGLPAAAALLLFPRSTRRAFSTLRIVLDAMVIAGSLLFISWGTVLGPLFAAGGSGLTRAASLGYPIVDVVVASLVLTLGMRVPPGARQIWLRLGSGLLLLALTDSIYVSQTAAGQTGTTGTPLMAGWVGAFLLIASAAAARTTAATSRQRQFTVVQELMPMVPVVGAVTVATQQTYDQADPFLLLSSVFVIVSLAAQQVVVALEKVRLANGLEETVEARTADLLTVEERFGSLVHSSDEAIFSKTVDGIVTSWNPAAERLYGFSAKDMLGKSVEQMVPADLREEELMIRSKVARGEQLRGHETERVRPDGARVAVAVTVSPIVEKGVVTGISAIGHDITERKRQQDELEEARTRALDASRAKSEFLATMSHEIRTPMNGVIGLTGLLLATRLDEVQRRYAQGVRGAGEALLGIIDDILDFSKLEAGKVDLEQAPFDPKQLMEEVGVLLASAASEKNLELVAFCDPDVPAVVLGDAGRLRQVLLNLASNAIKFTPEGEVVLRTRLSVLEAGECVLDFSVQDTGIGIQAADTDRLFEPFSQADASTTRRFGGTGLGLAICRRLVEAMSGELGLDSELGVGSTFRFSVPFVVGAEPAVAASATTPLRGLRVLVVDDNATNRLILGDQLAAWGVQADLADCAAQGWRLLQEGVAGQKPYDIAVLDMCMPEVDGLELAAQISADRTTAATRLMILTSAGQLDRTRLEEAGVMACVSKPVRSSELHDALVQVLADVTTADVSQPAPRVGTRESSGRILVVEDNEVNQMVAEGILRALGYEVDLADNGRAALVALTGTRYAAVLMDCHMPEMDGFEATLEIRRREVPGRRTPVIAMTAGVLSSDRDRCKAVGMDDFVPKPIEVPLLKRVLDRWTAPSAEADGLQQTPDVKHRPTPEDLAVIDHDRLAVLRGIGPQNGWGILPTVVLAFVDSAAAEVEALTTAQQQGDGEAMGHLLHRLKGSAANLGATRLADRCGQLEQVAARGDAVDAVAVDSVQRELADACDALSGLVAARA